MNLRKEIRRTLREQKYQVDTNEPLQNDFEQCAMKQAVLAQEQLLSALKEVLKKRNIDPEEINVYKIRKIAERVFIKTIKELFE